MSATTSQGNRQGIPGSTATAHAATTEGEPRESSLLLPGEDPGDTPSASDRADLVVSQSTIPWLAAALAVSLGLSVLLVRRFNRIAPPARLTVSTPAASVANLASVAPDIAAPPVAKPPKPPKQSARQRREAKHLAQ